jgi:osmotically-inducible protein OsmY
MKRKIRSRRTGDERDTLSDRLLAERLYRTFENAPEAAQVRGIHFYVHNGMVTIYGTVRHEENQEELSARIREIPGVKGVVEHVQVVEPYHQELRVEPELTARP